MTNTTDLQFERAQFDGGASQPACALCTTPLYSSYFEANGETVCERCGLGLQNSHEGGSAVGRLLRSTVAGLGAALGGALLYWAILAVSGYQFGLIAIVVGFAVGKAVHWGSQGRGGWAYQALAMGLTYLSIAGAYIPMIVTEIQKQPPAQADSAQSGTPAGETARVPEEASSTGEPPVVLGFAIFVLALALPFLGGIENIIGLIIIGIGLYEAWKLNRRMQVIVTGPHVLASVSPAGLTR